MGQDFKFRYIMSPDLEEGFNSALKLQIVLNID